MDLNQLNLTESAEVGASMILEHPTTGDALMDDAGRPITIELMGMDSSAYRNKRREIQAKSMARVMKGKGGALGLNDVESCELLAACTKGWSGIVEDGKATRFSNKAAFDLYMRHHWIREQVDVFIADRANFFTG